MVERTYSELELVVVSVVYACKQFRHYLLPKPFDFLTSYSLLPQLFNGSSLSKSMMSWVAELQEFQFSFLVEESTCATLADLLTYNHSPLLIKDSTMKNPKANVSELHDAYTSFFDGFHKKVQNASLGGLVFFDPTGTMVMQKGVKLNGNSNSEAQYAALEIGLQMYICYGVKHL